MADESCNDCEVVSPLETEAKKYGQIQIPNNVVIGQLRKKYPSVEFKRELLYIGCGVKILQQIMPDERIRVRPEGPNITVKQFCPLLLAGGSIWRHQLKTNALHTDVMLLRDGDRTDDRKLQNGDELLLKQLFEKLYELTSPEDKGYTLRLLFTGFMLIHTPSASHYPEYFFSTEKMQMRRYKNVTVKPSMRLVKDIEEKRCHPLVGKKPKK